MKKILITGKNSYVGRSFGRYCKKNRINFEIDELSVHGREWKNNDFSEYDAVLHVAGIAHRKETKENKHLYYEVNRDLAIEVAEKAKEQGIRHFIFISTMSVYGISDGEIDKNTLEAPINAYGDSKLQAEKEIIKLNDDNFVVAVIRPPMIYGPNSKGNYNLLSNFAKKTKIFPNINNQRSMLFIDNLSEFLVQIINNISSGYFYPQNKDYVNTSELVKIIATINNNNIIFTSIFNKAITKLDLNILNKVFGNLTYKKEMSALDFEYQTYGLEESIYKTETDELGDR